MNTNIYMLFDEFSPGQARLVAEDKAQSLDIAGVLFLSGGDTALDSDHLYVCAPEEVKPFLHCGIPLHLAIVGAFDGDEALSAQEHSAIIFPEESSMFAVFYRLQTAKEKFDKWDEEMLEAIIAKRPVKAVFEIGAVLLSNPVALFDKDFELIMTAGNLPGNVSGSIWEHVLAKNYSPPEVLSPKQRTEVRNRLLESNWPFVYRCNTLNENHMCCSLFVSGVYFGDLGLSEFEHFTEGQISVLACLAKRMEQALAGSFGESGITADKPYYISRLLSGYDIKENVIEYHLQQRGWRSNDSFRVLRIEPIEKTSLSEEECAAYRNPIKYILPDSIIFQYENGILVILHSSTSAFVPAALASELERLSLRAGVSMEFNNFMYVKHAYIQSHEALIHGNCSISFFEHCYAKCLFSTIGQITSLKSFCHPGILLEWQKGGEKERQFISSIEVYLRNGRNLTDTAKKLNIHRNTLSYRIERINEVIGLDLRSDNIDDNILLMLNTSCQIVTNLP